MKQAKDKEIEERSIEGCYKLKKDGVITSQKEFDLVQCMLNAVQITTLKARDEEIKKVIDKVFSSNFISVNELLKELGL